MFVDPLYLLLTAPGLLLALWAQHQVRSTFERASQVATARGLSGAETAAAILATQGVRGVAIEPVDGPLSDHYDPGARALRLSPDVYYGRTAAAAGVAAHEVGHALQHAEGYPWLRLRSGLVPALKVTSAAAVPTIVIGGALAAAGAALGGLLTVVGLVMFGLMVLFQLITLPVELDASRRALLALERGRIVTVSERAESRAVLRAAALTYVAAAVSSLMTLLYFILRSGLLGRRDD